MHTDCKRDHGAQPTSARLTQRPRKTNGIKWVAHGTRHTRVTKGKQGSRTTGDNVDKWKNGESKNKGTDGEKETQGYKMKTKIWQIIQESQRGHECN